MNRIIICKLALIAVVLGGISQVHADPKLDQQNLVIKELIDTERTYNQALKALKLHFLNYLTNDPTLRKDPFVQAVTTKLVNYVVPMTKLSDDVLEQLDKNKTPNKIAETLSALAPYFKMYGPYAADFTNIDKLIRDPKFSNNERINKFFLPTLKSKTVNLGGWDKGADLASLLILPIQRVPRYKDLLGALEKVDAGNKTIQKAIKDISEILNYINKYKIIDIK